MGQTLTNGVYLPDEGERNCYSGLAANWQILDNAVGTIAEHTTALAGKAPLVHTHTKSDITDFPAYGNTAGTICEGNDSRLSDARTPVAHTHTKSDVTDLLNSANEWSANNEYKYLIGLSGAEIWFKQPNIEDITANPSADTSKSILQIWNRATTQYCGGIADSLRTDGSHRLVISCFGFPLNNYAGYYPHTFYFEAKRDGTASFSPNYTNASLGTSTNKWKTLNGVNPGALSLPDSSKSETIDTTGYADSSNFYWTPPLDGWLFVNISNCSLASIKTQIGEYYINQPSGWYRNTVPVAKNKQVTLLFASSSLAVPTLTFYPCLGNV